MNDNDLLLSIGADTTGFDKAIKQLKEDAKKLQKQVKSMKIGGDIDANIALARKVAEEKLQLSRKLAGTQRRLAKQTHSEQLQQLQRVTERRLKAEQLVFKRKMVNARRAAAREAKNTVNTASTAKKTGHRHMAFGESIGIVAKYGAISQVLYGIQNAFMGVVKEIGRFDNSIKEGQSVLQLGAKDAQTYAKYIVKLGKDHGTAFADIQEGSVTIGRAGVEGIANLTEAMEQLSAMSVITGDSMADGAAGMAAMLSVFGKGEGKIKEYADSMTAVANATRLGLKDYTTIANYALVSAKAVGLNSDAYLALAGSMSKVGLNASTIGTSIRRLTQFTTGDSRKTLAFFDKIGMKQKDFAKSLRAKDGGIAGLKAFALTMAKLKPEDMDKALEGMNIQMRNTAVAFRLVGQNSGLDKMVDKINDAEGALKQAHIAAQGWGVMWKRTMRSMSAVFNKTFSRVRTEVDRLDKSVRVDLIGGIDLLGRHFEAWGSGALVIIGAVANGIASIVSLLSISVSGLIKMGGIITQYAGKALGGKSPEERLARVKEINKQLETQEAGRARVALRAERARLRVGRISDKILSGGQNTRKVGDEMQKAVIDATVAINKIAVAGFKGVTAVSDNAVNELKKTAKDYKKIVEDGVLHPVSPENQKPGGGGGASKRLAAAKALARLTDKQAKDQMKINEELMKQELLKYKMAIETGKKGVSASSNNYRIAKKEVALRKKLAKDNAKLVKGVRSRAELEKNNTKELVSQLGLMQKMSAEISRWSGVFDSMFSGDIGGMINGMFGDMFKGLQANIADSIGGSMGGVMGGLTGSMIGMGIEALKSIFGGKALSQQELDAAKGVQDVQSESIENILNMLSKTAVAELTYSKGIYENMRLLVKQTDKASVQLSDQDFNLPDYHKAGAVFGLFSSKTVTQLASGLQIAATSIDELNKSLLNAQMYTKKRVQKSSFFGIFSSDKIKTSYQDVDADVAKSISGAYVSGLSAIRDAAKAIGIDTIDELIKGFTTGTHDLNFKDKSQDEIAKMIGGAISKDFDTFIASVMPMIENFAMAGEGMLETLVRVAYEFEATANAINKIGGSLSILSANALEVTQAMVWASGSLDDLLTNVSGYISNFYSDAEQQAVRKKTLLASTGTLPSDMGGFKALIASLTAQASGGNVGAGTKLAELLNHQQTYFDYYNFIIEEEKRLAEEQQRIADERQRLLEKELEAINLQIAFYDDILKRITNAYTGSLSYLNAIEKASYLENLTNQQVNSTDSSTYLDNLALKLGFEKKMSTTRENYAELFHDYIDTLKGVEYEEKTLDDVVESIEEGNKKLEELTTAIERASYQ